MILYYVLEHKVFNTRMHIVLVRSGCVLKPGLYTAGSPNTPKLLPASTVKPYCVQHIRVVNVTDKSLVVMVSGAPPALGVTTTRYVLMPPAIDRGRINSGISTHVILTNQFGPLAREPPRTSFQCYSW